MDLMHECDAQGAAVTGSTGATGATGPVGVAGSAGVTLMLGKFYKSRGGRVFGPMQARIGLNYPFKCGATMMSFDAQGFCIGPSTPSVDDLLYECDPHGNRVISSGTNMVFVSGVGGASGGGGSAGGLTYVTVTTSGGAGGAVPPGNLIDRALAAGAAKESAEEERMRKLSTAEERLEEYRRKVAKLAERGNLY